MRENGLHVAFNLTGNMSINDLGLEADGVAIIKGAQGATSTLTIASFTAAVFGGIGSIPGAFLGGLLLGVIESLSKAYISTQLANTIVFAVLIVVLLVKPAGLLGKYVPEKV